MEDCMGYENVLTENRDGILWLTVNRPDKLNALNRTTLSEIEDVVSSVATDDAVWAMAVTGAGGKAFVAGADIGELNTLGPVEAKEFALRGQAIFRQIERLTKPVVAAVNGFALGGGCELAMACHIRVASANAIFGQPEVKLGLIPGYAGTQRLPRLVGRGRALEILLSGRNVSAEEAERIGLVNSVCDAEKLTENVEALLQAILANGPLAVAHCIEAVNHGLDLTFDDACLLEATLFGVGAASEEMREGTSAFLEKRKAQFRS
jgi:enoyl-CoA hydratase